MSDGPTVDSACYLRKVNGKVVMIFHDLKQHEDLEDDEGRCVYCGKVFERAGASNEQPGQQ